MINLKFYSIPLTVIINPQSKTERPIRNILYDKNTLFWELIGKQNVFIFFYLGSITPYFRFQDSAYQLD